MLIELEHGLEWAGVKAIRDNILPPKTIHTPVESNDAVPGFAESYL